MPGSRSMASILSGERECSGDVMYDSREGVSIERESALDRPLPFQNFASK